MKWPNANSNLLRLNLIFTLLFCVVYAFYSAAIMDGSYSTIKGDGLDYYSYLISIFIDHDLGHQDLTPWYVIATPTGTINLHTVGMALLWLPFFGAAYLAAALFHFELNGISFPFQVAIQVAGLFYGFVGLYFFQKIIVQIVSSKWQTMCATIGLLLGTNLLFYMVNSPAMSHIYSFALISVFVYLIRRILVEKEARLLIHLAVIFALIVLVRPFNVVVLLLLPIWSNSFKTFKLQLAELFRNRKEIILSFTVFVLLLSLQSIIWYFQNGKLLQDSYKGNGFNFARPHPIDFLFGFTSGVFIYAPLLLLALFFGFIKLFKLNFFQAGVKAFFFTVVVYLLSSYWAYTFSDSLGMRVMVDYYVIMGIMLAYAFSAVQQNILRFAFYIASVITVFFSLLFHYQSIHSILPPAYMTFDKFKYVFMKTDKAYSNVLGGCSDHEPYSIVRPSLPIFSCKQEFAQNYDAMFEYGNTFKVDSMKLVSNKLFLEIEIERTEGKSNSSSDALFACAVNDADKQNKFWCAFKINETPSYSEGNKRRYNYSIVIDKKINYSDKLDMFIWNIKHQSFTVNKFNVKVFDYNFET
jgi:hypothetical protein